MVFVINTKCIEHKNNEDLSLGYSIKRIFFALNTTKENIENTLICS